MRSFIPVLFLVLSTINSAWLASVEEKSPSYIDESLSFILGKLSEIELKVESVDRRLGEISATATVTMQHLLAQSSKENEATRSVKEVNQRVESLEGSLTEISKLNWKNLENSMTTLENLIGLFQNDAVRETGVFEKGLKEISSEIRSLSSSQGELGLKMEGYISRENSKVRDNRELSETIEADHKDLTAKVLDDLKDLNNTLVENRKILVQNQVILREYGNLVNGKNYTEEEVEEVDNLNTRNSSTDNPQNLNKTEMTQKQIFENCSIALRTTQREGVHRLQMPQAPLEYFEAFCVVNGWTVIQRRHNGSIDFERDWKAFRDGFGDPNGDHWLGLEKLHAITSRKPHILLIALYDSSGSASHWMYSNFRIGPEKENYFVSNIFRHKRFGNLLGLPSRKLKFMTYERAGNCGELFAGAWWYENCDWGDKNNWFSNTINGKEFDWSMTEMMINFLS